MYFFFFEEREERLTPIHLCGTINVASLRLLSLERPAYEAGLWLTPGNLALELLPAFPT